MIVAALDTIAGAAVLAVGVLGWRGFRTSAWFALATTVAWFVVPVAPFLVFLHRPLLLHTILALPRRRVGGWLPGVLLVVAWVGAALPRAVQPWGALATAVLCVVVSARMPRSGPRGRRPEDAACRSALLLFAAGLALPVLERMFWPQFVVADLPIVTYLGAVICCAGALVRGILVSDRHGTDAVVELSAQTPAEALVELRRRALSRSEQSLGLAAAIALLEENLRLQQHLEAQIEEVRTSRTRLVGVAVDERQRLERLLANGALRYLEELEACLTSTTGFIRGDPMVAKCLREVAHTRDDLEQLARGLHPRVLGEEGLAAALGDLSERSPVPIEVKAPAGRFPERIETTLWYACAEVLANVWKHARATEVSVDVAELRGVLSATIRDNGVGGARMSPGGGLTGLADRLSAVDGELTLASSECGTAVNIRVPFR
jgi:signal transduction histidine kinase